MSDRKSTKEIAEAYLAAGPSRGDSWIARLAFFGLGTGCFCGFGKLCGFLGFLYHANARGARLDGRAQGLHLDGRQSSRLVARGLLQESVVLVLCPEGRLGSSCGTWVEPLVEADQFTELAELHLASEDAVHHTPSWTYIDVADSTYPAR